MEDLKKTIVQDLEDSGYFDKMRAEIRAGIFQAAEKHESRAMIQRAETAGVMDSELGQICAALVKDFMASFKLKNSLSIFVPESHLTEDTSDIEELEQMFQVKSEPGRPLLFSVIEFLMQDAADSQEESQEEALRMR